MSADADYSYWSECSRCGFKGMFGFYRRQGEDYDDEDALGVLLDTRCPACGDSEPVLVGQEQWREMVLLTRRGECS